MGLWVKIVGVGALDDPKKCLHKIDFNIVFLYKHNVFIK